MMRAKDRKWLEKIARRSSIGMYPGVKAKEIPPTVRERLRSLGLIEEYEPNNPAHDYRYVATNAGCYALKHTERRE
jgi:hypothetical protein